MDLNTLNVSKAFTRQSVVFDRLSEDNKLSEYLRSKFRKEVSSHLGPYSKILELNCGTGLDALYFGRAGHHVLATDNSPDMLARLEEKINASPLEGSVEPMLLSYHDIHQLRGKQFDYIISNFGGLNCTKNLDDVLFQLSPLLRDKGKVTMVIMPKISLWDLLMVFKGKFRTAFRRFGKHSAANIEGVRFSCYYYNPSYVIKSLSKDFKLSALKGIFIAVPPEFMINFVNRNPKLFSVLSRIEKAICSFFPFTYCCDHYLITLEKK